VHISASDTRRASDAYSIYHMDFQMSSIKHFCGASCRAVLTPDRRNRSGQESTLHSSSRTSQRTCPAVHSGSACWSRAG